MLTAIEDSIKSLSDDEGEIIVDSLALTKVALERLYESSEGLFPKEEILEDLRKIVELSERIKTTENLREKMKIFFSEYQALSGQLKTKYGDFLPSRAMRKLEVGEKYIEGLKKLLVVQEYMLQALDEKDSIDQAGKLYAGMVKLSEVLEKYIPYFPTRLIEVAKNTARGVLADRTLQPNQPDISPEAANYLTAIKNTARDVLWPIDNYEREKKHTVGELLDWLETAPSWAGDDFEECLEYVNQVRK